MTLLSAAEARQLSDEFAPQFSSPDAFATSWRNCFEKLKRPSAESARRWLQEDLVSDSAMAAGLPRGEPVLPLRQSFELSNCRHCGGLRYVRADVPVGDVDFGRAIACAFCDENLKKNHDKTACEICRKPRIFSGYFGPETATVPADWQPGDEIPADWQPQHGGHR